MTERLEDALHDVLPFRQFAGICDTVPDRTTIMNFRHFLEKHHAGEQILALINQKLKQAGLMLRQGIIIDATIISAPCSVKIKPVNGILKCIRPAREISGTLV